ncbi:MAG: peptide MFS transporter [Crocinitomicaceae bacterium]
MQGNSSNDKFFESKVLGHPAGLFVLFFTEMWERFSYYGMRALLVLFLISSPGLGGWDWDIGQAMALYGTYTAMVYLTPIAGGFIADRIIGYRRAVIIGALLMTLGHASMAMETEAFLYIGIALLIFGNGFFKPNMTSIISHMYKDVPEKKDGAYTIFYMGVNAGAFLGIMLCGYIGETVSWSYGFGLAGIFMLMGMFQFIFAQGILGTIGLKPERGYQGELEEEVPEYDDLGEKINLEDKGDKFNPFTPVDRFLMWASAVIAVVWIINDPLSEIAGINMFPFEVGSLSGASLSILLALAMFLFLLVSRILRYGTVVMDKMMVVAIFAFFTVFFWASFEQAGGSMTIFARGFTDRVMSGGYYTLFIVLDIIITVVPIAIITWVLIKLFQKTIKHYLVSNIILGLSFVFIWIIVIWKINRNLDSVAYEAIYQKVQTIKPNEETGILDTTYAPLTESTRLTEYDQVMTGKTTIIQPIQLRVGQSFNIVPEKLGEGFIYLSEDRVDKYKDKQIINGKPSEIVEATVISVKENEVSIPATWFGILNSLFIIMFAPLFSRWWEGKYNPSGPVKYGLGLILLGVGFGALAFGALPIIEGGESVLVSPIWLVLAYLFHTLGELCLSPVGLSYVSKLVPARMIAFMFGVWYLAVAIGNKLAGTIGGMVEEIQKDYSLAGFFLIFTLIPIAMGILAVLLNPIIKKFMHGVK